MLQIHNLIKSYSSFKLQIDNISVQKNEICGIVGNNGAGKSTLLNSILDLIEIDNGIIKINDVDVKRRDSWKQYVGAYYDESFLIDFLSPEEFFLFTGMMHDMKKEDIELELNLFAPFFSDKSVEKKIKDFSMGNKQKIGIIGAFLHRPKLIILDEPFSHLDPSSRIILQNIILDYKQKHDITFIISSHDINIIQSICDNIILLDNGVIKKVFSTKKQNFNELTSFFIQEYCDIEIKS